MCGDQKRAGIKNEDLKALGLTKTKYLIGAVATEHSRTNNDRVELPHTVGSRFVPRVTDKAAENIDTERCVLHVRRRCNRLPRIE